jgi:hypothetical protein
LKGRGFSDHRRLRVSGNEDIKNGRFIRRPCACKRLRRRAAVFYFLESSEKRRDRLRAIFSGGGPELFSCGVRAKKFFDLHNFYKFSSYDELKK